MLVESQLALPDRRVGKVRESYRLPDGQRLLVTTDRLSAFDRVLGCVPHKGQVLNQLSAWWFRQLSDTHYVSLPSPNAMVVWEAEPLPVEVVVRGYITGVTSTSLWHRYSLGERELYGYVLPEGLVKNQALPEPLLTPTTKGGPTGHDERLTCAQAAALLGPTWDVVAARALELFAFGQQMARARGLTLVDTKYEFGLRDGRVILIDEVHTPDSSRFWDEDGRSLDKEFVREAYAARGYRGEGEPPEMPASFWEEAGRLYVSLYERLTGETFVAAEFSGEGPW